MKGHKGRVRAVVFAHHGRRSFVVSGGEDDTVRLWELDGAASVSGALMSAIAVGGETLALALWRQELVVGARTGLIGLRLSLSRAT
jgi:WD40 repeat protein